LSRWTLATTNTSGHIVPAKVTHVLSFFDRSANRSIGFLWPFANPRPTRPRKISVERKTSPECWLPESVRDPRSPFYSDNHDAMQAFSPGPRNWIGKNSGLQRDAGYPSQSAVEFRLDCLPGVKPVEHAEGIRLLGKGGHS
jgi:hypothetical protein